MADGSGSVAFDWADGTYSFRLAIGQLRELQDKTGIGPAALFDRLSGRDWRVDDLRETIRLGLIGGGMDPLDALVLVRRYVDERPLLESVQPAFRIMVAALVGVADDPAGKKKARRTRKTAVTPSDASASAGSTDTAS